MLQTRRRMAAIHRQYLGLGFHDDREQEVAFAALVQHFLLINNAVIIGQRREEWSAREADPLIAKFLGAYGEELWPWQRERRQHIANQMLRIKARGFVYNYDTRMNATARRIWRTRHGREPDVWEIAVASKLGRQVGAYFRAAVGS